MRPARESLEQGGKVGRQTNDRPEFTQTRDVLRTQDYASSSDDNRWLARIESLQDRGLFFPETLFSETGENFRDRHAEGGRDHLIGIEAGAADHLGEPSSDRRFAGTHEADQDN